MMALLAGLGLLAVVLALTLFACRTKAPTEPERTAPRVQEAAVCSPDSIPPCYPDYKPRAP